MENLDAPGQEQDKESAGDAARRAELHAIVEELNAQTKRREALYARANELLGINVLADAAQRPRQNFTWQCWVDQQPCPVGEVAEASIVEGMNWYDAHPELPYGERYWFSRENVQEDLEYFIACDRCPKPAQRALARLPGLRLGERERRILCMAPGPDEEERELAKRDARPSITVAQQRARRGLEKAGLLQSRWRGSARVRGITEGMLSRLSPLGAAVVSVCRSELESGGRIRWDRKRDEIAALVPHFLRDPVRETGRRMAENSWSKLAEHLAPVLCAHTTTEDQG
jgi:hypothetical protein